MIGLTVSTPSYENLATEACKRFEASTGLKARVVRVGTDEDGFPAKLEMWRTKADAVFFDSDLWVLRKTDFSKLPDWSVVHDPCVFHPESFCFKDCQQPFEEGGLLRDRYFNTGMMKVDFRKPLNREVFKRAAKIAANVKSGKAWKPHDTTDQYYINRAVLELGVPITFLPYSFNYYHKAVEWGVLSFTPREVRCLHAAGYPLKQKMGALRSQARVFGAALQPMQMMALQHKHTTTFEI
jgi:hypothetical protein